MKKSILIVDDEQAVCDMLKKFLSRKGYEISTALSGEEAIKKIKKKRPHIVLLDIRMPAMDGIETLKGIREFDKELGVVMITAVREDAVGIECMNLGAYSYITKPFDLEYMERVLLVKLLDFENEIVPI